MSNIDQAFINAYSEQSAVTAHRSSYAVREPGPTLRVFSQVADRETAEYRIDQHQFQGTAPNAARSAFRQPQSDTETTTRQQIDITDLASVTLPSLIGERKPLSAFTAAKPVPPAVFKPVYEVDEFRWPAITDDLVATSRELLSPIVELLLAIAAEGRTLIGIGGADARVGTSTVTMCLARLIVEAGRNVAMVDGNFAKGDLARTLGLEFNQGWEDVLVGNMPLAECAVASLSDKMTLIPLSGPLEGEAERLASIQSSVIAGMLRYNYDLVLFDLGAASDPIQLAAAQGIVEHCRMDAGIILATVGTHDPITLYGIEQLKAVFGQMCLGTIGNRAGRSR
jgi:Mrp family chromosome partitioning ATPase